MYMKPQIIWNRQHQLEKEKKVITILLSGTKVQFKAIEIIIAC